MTSPEVTELLCVKSKLIKEIDIGIKYLNLIQKDIADCQLKLDTMKFMRTLGVFE